MQTKPSRTENGNALIATLLLSGVIAVATAATLQLSSQANRNIHGRTDWNEAYLHAENAFGWAVQTIADAPAGGSSAAFLGQYGTGNGQLTPAYMAGSIEHGLTRFSAAWATIDRVGVSEVDTYRVTVSAQVGQKTRTLRGLVRKNPPSEVFDYEYFLNNWGWWWGSTIAGFGDNRANWDFDFRDRPAVNGSIFANGSICQNGVPVNPLSGSVPFGGLAGSDPVAHVHAGAPRVPMPNLRDFTYYRQLATEKGGQITVGGTVVVNAVHSDATKPGLYLVGTDARPIVISGPVVIPGDVVIKGKITGQGTLYVGGSLYVAGDTTYLNGPNFSTPPDTMPTAQRDQWVADNASRDLVGFAVRESIFAGDVNSSDWINNCYNPSGYGLKNVGAESRLGADGIADTGDDGVAFRDTNGDGRPDSSWYDADGDGVVDVVYNHTTDIKMDSTRAGRISGYPVDSSNQPVSYTSCASNDMNRLDGIFYTNHAAAMRLARSNMTINGSVISRDEAIIFSGSARFVYDDRVHSRYSNDPNRHIDLGLPLSGLARVSGLEEIAPIQGFVASN